MENDVPVPAWLRMAQRFAKVRGLPEPAMTAHYPGGREHDQSAHAGGRAKLERRTKNPDGGFTVRPHGDPSHPRMDEAKHGCVVAIKGHSQAVSWKDWQANGDKILADYIDSKKDILAANPRYNLGGWHDPKTGKVWLDISEVVPDREEAIKLGKQRGEIAVYDLDAKTSIPTGGKGNAGSATGPAAADTAGGAGAPDGLHAGRDSGVRPSVQGPPRFAAADVDALLGRVAHYPGGHEHLQKNHGGGGVVTDVPGVPGHVGTSGVGLWENLPESERKLEEKWVMEHVEVDDGNGGSRPLRDVDEFREIVTANQTEMWGRATEHDKDWYVEHHVILSDIGDRYGMSMGQTAGGMALLSARKRVDQNLAEVEKLGKAIYGQDTIEVTQHDIDGYNRYIARRNKYKQGELQPHLDMKPGTYLTRPIAGERHPVATADFLVSDYSHLDVPRMMPQDHVYRAALVMRGDKTVDEITKGPKQRSFVNNLVDPFGGNDVTHDTWDYRAKFKGLKIKREVTVRHPVEVQSYNKKGQPIIGKDGKPVMRTKWVADKGPDGKPVKATVRLSVQELETAQYKVTPQNLFQGTGKYIKKRNVVNHGIYPLLTDIDRNMAADLTRRTGRPVTGSHVQAAVWAVAKRDDEKVNGKRRSKGNARTNRMEVTRK